MKILFVMCCFTVVQAATPIYGQRIELRLKQVTMEQVLLALSKQAKYDLVYDVDLLPKSKPIDYNISELSIEDALDQIFRGQPLEYEIAKNTIVVRPGVGNRLVTTKEWKPAQQRTITGKVTNEAGDPLPGVTVTVKGTSNGVMTNESGEYLLNLSDTQQFIVFTFVGFKPEEIQVGTRSVVNAVLSPQMGDLDEVVVVGMNLTQKKRAVTGSMATIQTKELKQSPVANLNNALAGRLPGLITVQSSGQPGEDAATMYIRGIATYGSSSPLVVVDGLPRRTGFSQIDPNEVESISILKDASSSALYGIQGANGVVVVTTKRGRKDQTPQIDFTYQNGLQQTTRLPKLASTYAAALYTNDKDANSGVQPRFGEEIIDVIKNGSEPYLYPDINWFEEILEKAARQAQYNLNISGSSNRVRYFVSGSMLNQGALLKYDNVFFKNYEKKGGFNRYNFRSNIDIDATKDLQIQVDLAGRLEDRIAPSSGFESIFGTLGSMGSYTMPMFNPDGSLGATSSFTGDAYYKNPYGLVTESGYNESTLNTMYGTISAKHKLNFITDGLSAQVFFSFENENNNHVTRSRLFDAFWYRGLDQEGNPLYQQTQIASTLSTYGSNNIEKSTYLDARLIYEKNWNDKHTIGGQVLANRTLRLFNYDLPYAYQGISGRVTYDYASKVFLEANVGYNGSENFPQGRRYGLFPSVSAGWIISDEHFMDDLNSVNFLKIRGSFGEVGNDKIGGQRWLYLTDFEQGGGYTFGVSPDYKGGFNESRIGNPFVTWERSQKTNIGIEASLFKNHLVNITLDVFKEIRTNILTDPGTVPDYLGLGTSLSALNRGIVHNKGIDGEIRFNKYWTSDFSTFVNLQLTYARNKVIENDQPDPAFPYQDLRGYEVGYVLGYKASGLFNSQAEIDNSAIQSFDNRIIPGDIRYVDVNDDGYINEFDRIPIQNHNVPRYVGGFSFGASYKGLDISFLLNGAKGGTAIHYVADNTAIINERWTEENKENAKIPGAKVSSNNGLMSDFYTFKTDYLKLRNAEIGYIIPDYMIKTIGISYLRVFLNGQNLAVWDKLWIKDRDPEVSGGGFKYPIQRVFNFGVNVRL